LEELYEKHDKRALEMREIQALRKEHTPQGNITGEEGTNL